MTLPVTPNASNSVTPVPPAATGAAPPVPAPDLASRPSKKTAMSLIKDHGGMIAIAIMVVVVAVVLGLKLKPAGPGAGFVSGNGRVEATEVDIATKLAGRVQTILVDEGDFVQAGQLLAQMQVDVLNAQYDAAKAQLQQAITAVASAEAQVAARQSDVAAAQAATAQRQAELGAAKSRFLRTKALSASGAISLQDHDDDLARLHGAEAAVTAAQAQVAAAQAAIKAAEAQVIGANSAVTASKALSCGWATRLLMVCLTENMM